MKNSKIKSGISVILLALLGNIASAGVVSQSALPTDFSNYYLIGKNKQVVKTGSSAALDQGGYYSISEEIATNNQALFSGSLIEKNNHGNNVNIYQRVSAKPFYSSTKGEVNTYIVRNTTAYRSTYDNTSDYSNGVASYIEANYTVDTPVYISVDKNENGVNQVGLIARYQVNFRNTVERTLPDGRVGTISKNVTAGAINIYSMANGGLAVKTGGAISGANIARIVDAGSFDDDTKTYNQITNDANPLNNKDINSFTKDIDKITIVLDNIKLSANLWVYNTDVFSVDTYLTGSVVAREMEDVAIDTVSPLEAPEPSTVALLLSGCAVLFKKKRA